MSKLNTSIEETLLYKQLSEIIKKKPGIDTIFKASPYDGDHSIESSFTEQVFRKNCFCNNKKIKEFIKDLSSKIDNVNETNQYILFTGFPGNGKTTCIKEFIDKTKNKYQHYYFDISKNKGEYDNPDNAVMDFLKLTIKENFETIRKSFVYLRTYKENLLNKGFIGQKVFDFFEENERDNTEINERFVNKALDKFGYKEIYITLFIQRLLDFESEENKINIIYFDNLDVVSMEYLSFKFFEYFFQGVRNGKELVTSQFPEIKEKNIAFDYSFRFVFCLRDGNGENIKQHLRSRINCETITISFDSEHYSEILKKRLEFTKKLCRVAKPNKDAHFKEIEKTVSNKVVAKKFNTLLEDKYFTDILVPLFNRDYRKISSLMINKDFIGGFKLQFSKYGIGGNTVFKIIKHLSRDAFKGDNFVTTYLQSNNRNKDGYCYPSRVLITLGLNISNYSRGNLSNKLSVLDLLKNLDGIYSIEQIVDCIVECFLYHEGDWSHLLTILNQSVSKRNKETFKKDIIEKYNRVNEIKTKIDESKSVQKHLEKLSNLNQLNLNDKNELDKLKKTINECEYEQLKIENELDTITLRINDAGFTYVRHILTHFEFYSAIRGENLESLFELGLKENENVFLFEKAIDNVVRDVSNHIESMKTFFEKKYITRFAKESFYFSSYCFKYYGGSGVSQERGYFHSTRMVTQQIDYLSNFRLYLVNTENISNELIIRINKAIIERLNKYLELLNKSIDDEGKNKFFNGFKEKVNLIINSGYKDNKTKIELNEK